MKAKIYSMLLMLILLCCNGLHSQERIAFYDANSIVSLYKQNGKLNPNDSVLSGVLEGYYGTGADIASLVQQNPFLKLYFRGGGGASLSREAFTNISFSNIASSIGGLDVTNFADGLARFLIERSKEELNVAFFRRFREYMLQYPEMGIIFPTTSEFITEIASYRYAAMLPALRGAFQKDLNGLCANMLNLRNLTDGSCPDDNQACKNRIQRIAAFLKTSDGRAALGALIVADNMIKGNNAAEIINSLASDPVCQQRNENFSSMVQFTNLMSQSLRSKDDDRVWVTQTEINKLVNNEDALKIYLGLLYASNNSRDEKITFYPNGTTVTLESLLTRLADNWPSAKVTFTTALKDLGYAGAAVSDNTKLVSGGKSTAGEAPIMVYAAYASSISSYLKTAMAFFDNMSALNSNLPSIKTDVARFTEIIDATTEAAYDIHSKNYSSLALHSSLIIEKLYDTTAFPNKDKYITYASFMASVVEAQNADDVKAAIDAAVLPVGSSSIKRETNFNIALNAYIGPVAGTEYMPQLTKDKWKPLVGVTAPLGVAFSWGNIHNGKRNKCCGGKVTTRKNGNEVGGQSFSIFVPLIDVGTIATYRLGDDSTKISSKVELRNIIAPGLYFYYGFGKCPISFGVGGQVGPPLRDITATSQNVAENVYVRFGANLVVDIPFFNLYTKN